MATLAQMQYDLQLLGMNNIIQTDVTALLNKCQREEVESWDWSFLYTNIVINSVTPYNAGTLTVTNGSPIVTGTGTLFVPNMIGWFLNVGATLTTPIIVNAFVDATHLQLSSPWGGLDGANLGYSLFPLYYDVYPLIEVQRVRQIDFLTQTSQEALNRIDPSRLSTGGTPSLRWADAPWTQDGHFQVELWPRSTSFLPYLVDGKLGPVEMFDPNDLPQLPSQVLEAKAMMYLCRAAFASNSNPKWLQLEQTYRADYDRELQAAKTADDRRKVTLGISASGARGGVNSGMDYVYNHDAAGPPYIGGNE